MNEKDFKIRNHYHKLQENLGELMSPTFGSISRSLTYIILNQIYTHAECLFELVEQSTTLSKGRQALMAKLAFHIEICKENGIQSDFIYFIKADLNSSMTFIRNQYEREFELAS